MSVYLVSVSVYSFMICNTGTEGYHQELIIVGRLDTIILPLIVVLEYFDIVKFDCGI